MRALIKRRLARLPRKKPRVPAPLTAREREVVILLARARHLKDVAVELKISVATANVHRQNIMEKLGLHHRTELVVWAIVHELVSVDELGARYGFNPS